MAIARPHDLTDLDAPRLFVNRELSLLEFNQRVLDQASSDLHPLLERVKFLAIVGSNLDEFFMVRVATLLRKQRAGANDVSPDGLSVIQQLAAIRQRTAQMMRDHAACWHTLLRPALAAQGITFIEPSTTPMPSVSTCAPTSSARSFRCSRRWLSIRDIRSR